MMLSRTRLASRKEVAPRLPRDPRPGPRAPPTSVPAFLNAARSAALTVTATRAGLAPPLARRSSPPAPRAAPEPLTCADLRSPPLGRRAPARPPRPFFFGSSAGFAVAPAAPADPASIVAISAAGTGVKLMSSAYRSVTVAVGGELGRGDLPGHLVDAFLGLGVRGEQAVLGRLPLLLRSISMFRKPFRPCGA